MRNALKIATMTVAASIVFTGAFEATAVYLSHPAKAEAVRTPYRAVTGHSWAVTVQPERQQGDTCVPTATDMMLGTAGVKIPEADMVRAMGSNGTGETLMLAEADQYLAVKGLHLEGYSVTNVQALQSLAEASLSAGHALSIWVDTAGLTWWQSQPEQGEHDVLITGLDGSEVTVQDPDLMSPQHESLSGVEVALLQGTDNVYMMER